MLRKSNALPLDYSLCCMTVTVYHREGLTGQVLHNVHLEATDQCETAGGVEEARPSFLLVVPGQANIVPGDRVEFAGKCMAVRSVKKRYFQGRLCHTEVRG